MEKILIVEDDLSFGTIIQAWLRKKGFEVEKTTSVKSAIAAWEETAKQGNAARGFDLVLSDLRLPDKDGIFLLRWMREHGMKARHFNSGGADTEQLRAKLLDELADLTAFRLNAEKVLGKLYGNAEAYRL